MSISFDLFPTEILMQIFTNVLKPENLRILTPHNLREFGRCLFINKKCKDIVEAILNQFSKHLNKWAEVQYLRYCNEPHFCMKVNLSKNVSDYYKSFISSFFTATFGSLVSYECIQSKKRRRKDQLA